MKTAIALAALLATASLASADSKRTAEYILTDPTTHQDTEVTLDVAFVKPVHFVSPFPELAFFHALTMDRTDKRPGGGILVAIPAEQATAFAKKYGTDFDGRSDMDTLRGTLVAAGPGPRGKIWLVDNSGKFLQLTEERKKNLPEEAAEMADFGGGAGVPAGPGPRGPGPMRKHIR